MKKQNKYDENIAPAPAAQSPEPDAPTPEQKPSKKTRRELSNEEKALMDIFHANLEFALDHRPKGGPLKQAELARKMDLSRSVITSWTRRASFPSVPQLVSLSRILGRDVKWLLEKHSFDNIHQDNDLTTYTDIFNTLLLLIERQAIDKTSIKDYFLQHMVSRYYEVSQLKRVPDKTKDEWLIKLFSDFNVPVMPQLDPLMYTVLEEEYKQFDKDTTVLKILELVKEYWAGTKKNELDSFYAHWLQRNNPVKLDEMNIQATIEDMGAEKFFEDDQD